MPREYKLYIEDITESIKNIEDYIHYENQIHLKTWNEPPSFYKIIANYLVIEIIRILSEYEKPITLGKTVTIDFDKFRTDTAYILKIPNCPSCKTK